MSAVNGAKSKSCAAKEQKLTMLIVLPLKNSLCGPSRQDDD